MILISYDISNTKTRTKFAKFLEKYGERIQFSVFRIKNSNRILNIITEEIKLTYAPLFKKTDSIYVFRLNNTCMQRTLKFGYAVYEDKDVVQLGK